MKKTLYILCAIFALTACSKDGIVTTDGPNPDGSYTFNVAIEEPEDAQQTKAPVKMGRYLLEMYKGSLEATPVKMENNDGVFKVTMEKDANYICLFWADDGAVYDATDLKAVKQTDETALGTAAYCASVTINRQTFNGAVTLKRAVAELSFIDKIGLIESDNTLKITYPYASAMLNVGDGTVTYTPGTAVRTITGITPFTELSKALATDLILAPKVPGKITGIKCQLNSEEQRTIPETAIQANYKTKITGQYQLPLPSMKFTVDTRKNTADDATFIIPLNATLGGFSLKVDWGDGKIDFFAEGTSLNQTSMTHTYPSPGVYSITIFSSQKNPQLYQCPNLSFAFNYPTVNKNSAKLISLDSPLLNMMPFVSNCFSGCSNLTTIHPDLFANSNNHQNFDACFAFCTSLTTIPEKLFEPLTEALSFAGCFLDCTNLTNIPANLFAKNSKVTDFYRCFRNCTNLKTIPAELFANNTKASRFDHCFSGCTNLETIPVGLFAKNTDALRFDYSFFGCAKSVLNSNIFCNEADEKNSRFAGKQMDFSQCFGGSTGGGTAPALWEYEMAENSVYGGCFSNSGNLTNQNNIPSDWK